MKLKAFFGLVVTVAALVAVVLFYSHTRPSNLAIPQSDGGSKGNATETADVQASPELPRLPALPRHEFQGAVTAGIDIQASNKLERLSKIREQFQLLAAGEPAVALRAAKQITDETERETALLALVTQWTHGELKPSRERARAIGMYGLEAGLGMELSKNPELAVTWANELTDGPGRQALLSETAVSLARSDPAAAFALGDQLPEDQRRQFSDSVFAGWAGKDTEAALQYTDQLSGADRDGAIQAIRTTAPVGIGTALAVEDGYPVVRQLLPGTPAEASGQIHQGDRILALAHGDNSFVNAQGIPLSDLVQMIRGAPGTTLQLQILSANAPPGSPPQTISITRDQLKFKN